jgi:hypothetical protein
MNKYVESSPGIFLHIQYILSRFSLSYTLSRED